MVSVSQIKNYFDDKNNYDELLFNSIIGLQNLLYDREYVFIYLF